MTHDDTAALVARLKSIAAIDLRIRPVPAHLLDTAAEAAAAIERMVEERAAPFHVCYCQLTSECHAITADSGPCEICEGPEVATPEVVEMMFRGYQKRAETAERQLAEARARIAVLEGKLRKIADARLFADALSYDDLRSIAASALPITPTPHRATWTVVPAEVIEEDWCGVAPYDVQRDGVRMNKRPFLSEVEAEKWLCEQVKKAREGAETCVHCGTEVKDED